MNINENEHDWFESQIATFLADGLGAEEKSRFESHAQNCVECAAELAQERELEVQMKNLFSKSIPASDFEDRVVGRLRLSTRSHFWVHPLVRKSAIAAAAVIVVGGIGYVGMDRLNLSSKAPVASVAPAPDGLQLAVNNLKRSATQPGTGAVNSQVFTYPLKSASWAEAEKASQLIFTGQGGQMRGVQGPAKQPPNGLSGRAVVVADPKTNVLLVTAPEKDWADIKRVLDELDQPDPVAAAQKVQSMSNALADGSRPAGRLLTIGTAGSGNNGLAVNNLSGGRLIIKNVESLSNANLAGNATMLFSGTGTTSLGGGINITNSINQGPTQLSVTYNDVNALNTGSFNGKLTPSILDGAGTTSNPVRGAYTMTAGTISPGNIANSGTATFFQMAGDAGVRFGELNVSNSQSPVAMGGANISTAGSTNSANINLSGGTLAFARKDASIAVNSGTLANSSLTKTGLGEVRFTQPNNLSGNLSINGGSLEITERSTLGSLRPSGGSLIMSIENDFSGGTQIASGTFAGRTAGSTGVLSPAAQSGSLNNQEHLAPGVLSSGLDLQVVDGKVVFDGEVGQRGSKPANDAIAMNTQDAPPARATTQPAASAPNAAPATQILRRVIREGTMEFEVESFDATFNQIGKITAEEGGVISSADSDKLPNGKVKGMVTVRVPPDRLDVLVLKLRALGDLKSQRLGSKDISKEYTDLESELRASRAMEERLLLMIKNAQGEVKDLLAAEKELATWRTKLEKIQGQMNYYNNLVSMATLQISAYEKDIRTPASANQTEDINAGIETNDVEGARAAALKSIDDAKGRIVESTLQQLDAGQYAAKIVAEVSRENAGPIVDRLKQLGRVARLDMQRKQTTETTPGARALGPAKVEEVPTRIIISMYNLANVAPRLTTNLNLAAEDVEASYRAVLKRIDDAQGRVISSNLNRQDANQTSGSIRFEVKSAEADSVLNDLRTGVQVMQLSVTENPDSANVTSAKQAFTVHILSLAQIAPRETRGLSIQTDDVESAVRSLVTTANTFGARSPDSALQRDADGKTIARMSIDLPLSKADEFLDAARKLGKVRLSESGRNPQVPDGPLARARINLLIGSADTIVPAEGGVTSTLREGLTTSVKGLLWSLQLIVVGICLAGPWALIGWGGWKLAKRNRRAKVTVAP